MHSTMWRLVTSLPFSIIWNKQALEQGFALNLQIGMMAPTNPQESTSSNMLWRISSLLRQGLLWPWNLPSYIFIIDSTWRTYLIQMIKTTTETRLSAELTAGHLNLDNWSPQLVVHPSINSLRTSANATEPTLRSPSWVMHAPVWRNSVSNAGWAGRPWDSAPIRQSS